MGRLWLLLACVVSVAACGDRGGGGDDDDDDDAVDDSPLTPDEVVRAGVVIGSCLPDDGIADWIVDYWDGKLDLEATSDLLRCVASRGGGCDALSCVGVTADLGGPCTPACSGTVFTACDDQLRFRMDCSVADLSCDPARGCVDGPPGESCDYETFVESCEEGLPRYCSSDQVEQGPVCADFGLECGIELGGAVCKGTLGDCDADSWGAFPEFVGDSCSGDTLEACVSGGLASRNCADVAPGFGCQLAVDEDEQEVAFCGLASECVPDLVYRTEATCDGSIVTFCNMGRLEHFDCTELGFTGCEPPLGCTPTGFSP